MSATHTPGPWTIRATDRAVVPARDPSRLVAHGGSIMPDDARLIAAAPDLLAALQAARIGLSCWIPTNSGGRLMKENLFAQIDAAIARATGAAT